MSRVQFPLALVLLASLARARVQTSQAEPARGPHNVASATPPCATVATSSGASTTPLAIPEQMPVTSSLTISGANTFVWDVDLTTLITHASSNDVDLTLTSPAGTVVTVSTGNGGNAANVFDGTLWDDQAAVACTDFAYVNLATASPLAPEAAFDAFKGEDPNGVWRLGVYDNHAGDTGVLHGWSLDVVALSTPLNVVSTSISSTDVPQSIDDLTTTTSTTGVLWLGRFLTDVNLVVDIAHTFCGDLDITLTSPSGTSVTVTTDNGGPYDNIFAGTTFDDDVLDAVTEHIFTNLVTAVSLSPEASLARFLGEDPNGIWTLAITDDRVGNTGVLNSWSLQLGTGGAAPAPFTHCAAGTSLHGCVPTMTFSQALPPSISAGAGFSVICGGMDGVRNGGMYYGLASAMQPVSTGSSFLCTSAPRQRLLLFPNNQTGGSVATCSGSLAVDFNTFIATHPGALGSPLMACQTLHFQAFNRDPGNASKSLVFSNGLAVTLNP